MQKGTVDGMTGVLARNPFRGSFYSHYRAGGARFGLVGEWSAVKNRFRSGFSLPHKLVIHSYVCLSGNQ
jgi:hypothetical protein